MNELQHFGIPGMHWGQRKALPTGAPSAPKHITYTAQIGHQVRRDAGTEAARHMLNKYGGTAVRFTGKAAAKGAGLVFSKRAAKGSGFALKLLGKTAKIGAKVAVKGGKGYLKTAVAIGKLGFKLR